MEGNISTNEVLGAEPEDDMLPDYSGLLKNGVRGRFAGLLTRQVTLAPDVARAYPTDEEVNNALRKLMVQEERSAAEAAR